MYIVPIIPINTRRVKSETEITIIVAFCLDDNNY